MNNTYLLSSAILAPIAGGILCFLLRHSVLRGLIIFLTAIILIVSSIILFTQGGFTYSAPDYWNTVITVLDFDILLYFLYVGLANGHLIVIVLALLQIAPLAYFEFYQAKGIEVAPSLVVDKLAIIMCLVISIVGSLIAIYAIRYMKDHEAHLKLTRSRQPIFFFFFILFLGAMNGLVFSNNLLWLYFFWEVTTLCCYQLIRHDLTTESKANAMRALWMNLIGGVAFLCAIILLFNKIHTLSIQEIITKFPAAAVILIPLALLCLAGFTKSAQIPFQTWLLGAMVAPTPVSALLHSSTMVKAGIYLILRFAPAFQGTPLSKMVMLVGAFSFLVTAIIALTQDNAKRLLAYSTIGNLGLIIMCAGINTPLAITAALLLLVFHAISKGLLFMCVGTIETLIHSREIERMAELITRLPLLATITVIGIITMFLAPFGLLVGKWAATEGLMSVHSISAFIAVIMLVLGSAATTVFWTKYLGRLLNRPETPKAPSPQPLAFLYKLPLISLVVMAIILSIMVIPFYNAVISPAVQQLNYPLILVSGNASLLTPFGSFATWPLFILFGLVLLMPLLILRAPKADVVPVYMCGENVSGDECAFCTVADKNEPLQTSGLYFSEILCETSLEKLFTPIGVIILVALFWLILK